MRRFLARLQSRSRSQSGGAGVWPIFLELEPEWEFFPWLAPACENIRGKTEKNQGENIYLLSQQQVYKNVGKFRIKCQKFPRLPSQSWSGARFWENAGAGVELGPKICRSATLVSRAHTINTELTTLPQMSMQRQRRQLSCLVFCEPLLGRMFLLVLLSCVAGGPRPRKAGPAATRWVNSGDCGDRWSSSKHYKNDQGYRLMDRGCRDGHTSGAGCGC